MIEIKKKEGEHVGSFVFRFNKKVKQSGVMREMRKRKFQSRAKNKNKRRKAALYKVQKQAEYKKARKHGSVPIARK
ncbi:hypothetical protein A3I34_01875 [Candidatus Jorgensenbacteria bacterium RIFCSPLOWO2_02_FULL_45_12]|uniref:30S ribosomal protein S21 n=2 Tax=Candidatus Joergenseniibacteriota TaxID=1752739 RepID=A0A1F6BMT0_9BACT|nr:MAG: hypothetical protein UX22_C0004G0069 [Candidatus Jorgensenbacteria bacterium GW2011_GWA2_45_9]OGG38229.1 MAG: hypothetical protein A3D55_01635 [Candidatus Jorgensenbacteria bacterium RIFCSPHIGHO2_02_FULL_45_20]OGG42246.1 MAG: hypothetical protein A3I34_01875 [Candidatus Jorgensenbacteria bacterium RIFCSPLOWO2_02_FULL_45_12]